MAAYLQHSPVCRLRLHGESAHASLCALGAQLRRLDFFRPLVERAHLRQTVRVDTPTQTLPLLFVAVLAGARAVAHADTTLLVDPVFQRAFGLPGCAEQSVLADTLNAATEREVADRRAAVEAIFARSSRAHRPDYAELSSTPTGLLGERNSLIRGRHEHTE